MIALSTETNGTRRPGSPTEDELNGPSLGRNAASVSSRPREADAARPASYQELSAELQNEAERLFTNGQYGDAELKVRHLLELQNQVVGQEHEDFALGLSMLGELRFLQGDRVAAEGMFRRALVIREMVLGRSHLDYAVSLTCLASLLWRRDALDEAERCLREALAIRCEALGPGHPESVQGRKELVRILRQRGRWAEAQALSRQLNEGAGHENRPGTGRDLPEEVVALSSDLAKLGATLGSSARLMTSPGAPPPDPFVRQLEACRRRFESLRAKTRERIAALRVPNPPQLELETLEDLASVIDDLIDAELQQHELEQLRLTALTVLDRVLALTDRRGEEFPPLRDCLTQAAQLRNTIESAHWLQLPPPTESLADGTDPLVYLLSLVEQRETLSDRDWAELHESVGESLGKALAIAASRGRLVVRDVTPRRVDASARTESLPRAEAVAVRPSVSSQPTKAPEPIQTRDPRSSLDHRGLLSDLAVASLVPSMGTVINLPTASPTDPPQAHRLLRLGQAPNVVEPSGTPGDELGAGRQRRADRRINPPIVAGPLHLLNSSSPVGEPGLRTGPITASQFGSRKRSDESVSQQLASALAPLFHRARGMVARPT